MSKAVKHMITAVLMCGLLSGLAYGADDEIKKEQSKKKGPPPALVVLAQVKVGSATPMSEFVGTVYYTKTSSVATEVAGKAVEVNYEEGQKVKKGQQLVSLNSELINPSIEGLRASYEQAVLELERAQKDLSRMATLFKEKTISESLHDDHSFRVMGLEKKAISLKAALVRLELQKTKMTITAPFEGIIQKKTIQEGEWVSVGGTVAVVAASRMVDVIVDVPGNILGFIRQGQSIEVKSMGNKLKGKFIGFIPKGDVATRTFSIKIRLRNTARLIEGMEASALIPTSAKTKGLLVTRDAVINKYGMDVVFASIDNKAKMIPVKVVGYNKMQASILGKGLEAGMQVVVKGNERIRDGQPLRTVGPKPANAPKAKEGK